MRVVTALLIAVASTLLAIPARADSADEREIRDLEANYSKAVNAKDLDNIMKTYVPDESLFVFDAVPPRQYVGAAAYRKDWQEFLGFFNGPVKFSISDLAISTNGDLGYSHSIQSVTGTDSKGQSIALNLRVTDIYRKTGGKWLIVHEHISVPVDLETQKPDLQSRP